jgi:hypothetical protein
LMLDFITWMILLIFPPLLLGVLVPGTFFWETGKSIKQALHDHFWWQPRMPWCISLIYICISSRFLIFKWYICEQYPSSSLEILLYLLEVAFIVACR